MSRLLILIATLLPSAAAVHAEPESLAQIFSNAPTGKFLHPGAIPRRASIILIACHGLSWSDLSCYGQTNFQTPNLDRLAAEGMRFTNYRAGGDDLPGAQAALMTGGSTVLSPGGSTLALDLQQVGYHTGLIGEWTLGDKPSGERALGAQPWTQGFDEFAGFLTEREAANYYSDFLWRFAPRSVYDETNRTLQTWSGREEIYDNTGGKQGKFIPDLLLSAAANFARVNAPDFANHYRPFFLMVNLPLPHSVTPGKDEYPVPTDAPFTGENWPQAAKNRAALLSRLDEGMGRLLEQLRKVKLTNNVAIFLTGAGAPEKFADTNLNFLTLKNEVRGGTSEDRLRVPMIVRWPDHVPAGSVNAATWSASDFGPTALEIAYAKPVASFKGASVLPVLLGQQETNAPDLRQEK